MENYSMILSSSYYLPIILLGRNSYGKTNMVLGIEEALLRISGMVLKDNELNRCPWTLKIASSLNLSNLIFMKLKHYKETAVI